MIAVLNYLKVVAAYVESDYVQALDDELLYTIEGQ